MPSEKGKVAIVTGGSSGIGLAVTKMLLSKGIKVFATSRDPIGHQSIERALDEIGLSKLQKIEWDYMESDVSHWERQVEIFTAVVSRWERVDYVFANAGIGERVWLPTLTPKEGVFVKPDLTVLDVDLTGSLYTVALAIQQFRRQKDNDLGFKGKIFLTASICGFYCIPSLPTYTAAKHALVGFTRSYSQMVMHEHIMVNAICPNVVRTNISTSVFYETLQAKDILTPMETLIEQFESLMGADKRTGLIVECGPKGVSLREPVDFMDVESEESCEMLKGRGTRLYGLDD